MFKYTPKQEILRDMQVPTTGRFWDKEYFKRKEILKSYNVSQEYMYTAILSEHYKNTCFFSPSKVQYVPIRGYLFPAEMFDVSVI